MSIFGWSYPAGCSGPPDNEDPPCECCGREVGICICPECPQCGTQGDPACYSEHGLVYNQEQLEGKRALLQRYKAEAEAERAIYVAWVRSWTTPGSE